MDGSVGKADGGYVAVAILDADWMKSGRGDTVDPMNPEVRLAAYLAVNEPAGENPWPLVTAKGVDHYRVDSSYFAQAEAQLNGWVHPHAMAPQ